MDVDTCRQLIEELLSSYVDGELDNATAQSLELHLQMCPPCAAFFRTFKATKRCVRGEAIANMPEDCEQSLWSFLEHELGDELGDPGKADAHGCCGGAHKGSPHGKKKEPPRG
jgi:hypothetical protein